MKRKWLPGLYVLVCLFLINGEKCCAEIAGDEAFSGLVWEQVYEDQIQGASGIVQSICATDDYIICIENTSDDPAQPDIISAYYKNEVDENGNPVEQYSLAKRVSDTSWEHGNGMAYNPNTHEIYVALYTNMIPENRGCLYVMDPDTLAYKRTLKVADNYNILGIDYMEESDQYMIQTNIDGGYSFKILDANFQLVEDLGSYADTAKGNNFQDLAVDGDYIMNFPLTLNLGIGDYLHVYSISRRALIADPQIDFRFDNVIWDEPESLCEIAPGVYLSAINVVEDDGSKMIRFYKIELPYYFYINITSENGDTISQKVLRGESYNVPCTPQDGYRLSSLIVNGQEQIASDTDYYNGYTLENIQQDQEIQLRFEPISTRPASLKPQTPVHVNDRSSEPLQIKTPLLIGLASLASLIALYCFYTHIRLVRIRKKLRSRKYRQALS